MNIEMIASADDTNSLMVSGMTPMEFDRLRMIILHEWEPDNISIGEMLSVTDDSFIKNPIDEFLSGLTA